MSVPTPLELKKSLALAGEKAAEDAERKAKIKAWLKEQLEKPLQQNFRRDERLAMLKQDLESASSVRSLPPTKNRKKS